MVFEGIFIFFSNFLFFFLGLYSFFNIFVMNLRGNKKKSFKNENFSKVVDIY